MQAENLRREPAAINPANLVVAPGAEPQVEPIQIGAPAAGHDVEIEMQAFGDDANDAEHDGTTDHVARPDGMRRNASNSTIPDVD